jgi:YcxB-like protein
MPYVDYLAANWLMIRRAWLWRGLIKYLLVVGVILTAIIESGYLFRDGFDAIRLAGSLVAGLVCAACALAINFLWYGWCIPRNALKAYAELKLEGVETTYTFDQNEVQVASSLGTSQLPWDHITSWAENDQILLLFRTRLMFFCISKQQIPTGVIDELRSALVAANVPNR